MDKRIIMTNTLSWPEFYPDQCPPLDSLHASGIVYRLINRNQPNKRDFQSYKELGRPYRTSECRACSLSVYTDIADVDRLKRRIPSIRKKKVASGQLADAHGKIKHTPHEDDSHHSWWMPLRIEPWLEFRIVE